MSNNVEDIYNLINGFKVAITSIMINKFNI